MSQIADRANLMLLKVRPIMGRDFVHMGIGYYIELEKKNDHWCWWYKVEGGSLRSNKNIKPISSRDFALKEVKEAACQEIREMVNIAA